MFDVPLTFFSSSLLYFNFTCWGWGSFFSLLINSHFNSMAVDVTSLVLMMNGYREENHHQQQKTMMGAERDGGEGLITRDLLGNNNSLLGSKELDLDLQVPLGWEKRLDLKSGKVYIQRCNSPPMSSSSTTTASSEHDQNHRQLQDLNFPPPPLSSSKNINMMIEDDTTLELKLFPSSSSPSTTTCTSYHNYRNQSVCTLDKVKSALERAEKEKEEKKPAILQFDLSSSSSSNREDEAAAAASSSPMFAAGCPSCLLYVLISKTNPLCPRCNSIVPVPVPVPVPTPTPVVKKPRIDLNSALM